MGKLVWNTKKVDARLKELDLNQSRLAVKMNLTRQAVNYYWGGRYASHRPNFRTVEKVANALGLNGMDLLLWRK